MNNTEVTKQRRGKFRNLQDMWIRMRRNKLAMVGLVIIILLALLAIFADVIAPY